MYVNLSGQFFRYVHIMKLIHSKLINTRTYANRRCLGRWEGRRASIIDYLSCVRTYNTIISFTQRVEINSCCISDGSYIHSIIPTYLLISRISMLSTSTCIPSQTRRTFCVHYNFYFILNTICVYRFQMINETYTI